MIKVVCVANTVRVREPESGVRLLWSGLKSPRRFCHVPEAATNLLGSILRHGVYTYSHKIHCMKVKACDARLKDLKRTSRVTGHSLINKEVAYSNWKFLYIYMYVNINVFTCRSLFEVLLTRS